VVFIGWLDGSGTGSEGPIGPVPGLGERLGQELGRQLKGDFPAGGAKLNVEIKETVRELAEEKKINLDEIFDFLKQDSGNGPLADEGGSDSFLVEPTEGQTTLTDSQDLKAESIPVDSGSQDHTENEGRSMADEITRLLGRKKRRWNIDSD